MLASSHLEDVACFEDFRPVGLRATAVTETGVLR